MRKTNSVRGVIAATALIAVVILGGCGPRSTVSSTGAGTPSASATTPTTVAPRCAATVTAVRSVPTPQARIRSVTFHGSASDPTVVVVGTGFASTPPADPSVCPAKLGSAYHPGCNTQPAGGSQLDGMDYGPKAVGVAWLSSGKETSAGKYVPGVYLDCIGVLISHWSPTKVVFSFGSQYSLYAEASAGKKYTVEVAGRARHGVIHYSAS